MSADLTRTSRFLSLILRHKPEVVGVRLDAHGWADVDALLAGVNAAGLPLSRAVLEQIVAEDAKGRYAFSPDGNRIRAVQGHSVLVDLGLAPRPPPEVLFHGTSERNLPSIRADGLRPGTRQHVHLSPDEATALRVGRRHGRPVVLAVRAGELWRAGQAFYLAENGVWLTAGVPATYLEFPAAPPP